jgi:DNA-binding NarL/FixJ family response regulator
MSSRVLLVGQGLFLDGLTRLLSEQPSVSIVGAARDLTEAQSLVQTYHPDTVIVDHADTAPTFESSAPSLQVIYLTLAENRMVVHSRQEMAGPTARDLVRVIRGKTKRRTRAKKVAA